MRAVTEKLLGHVAFLAAQTYSTYVIEACLQHAENTIKMCIIDELFHWQQLPFLLQVSEFVVLCIVKGSRSLFVWIRSTAIWESICWGWDYKMTNVPHVKTGRTLPNFNTASSAFSILEVIAFSTPIMMQFSYIKRLQDRAVRRACNRMAVLPMDTAQWCSS